MKVSFFQKLSSYIINKEAINNDCLLAFDIGTKFVRAAVFNIALGKEGRKSQGMIFGVGRAEIKKSGDADEIEELIKSCREAKKEAENMAGCKVRQAIVGMAGRPIRCSTGVISCQRKNFQKPIDLSEIKIMIQKAQWKAFDEIRRKEALECGLSETEIKLVDGKIINVKIDGYNVIDPTGFQGKEVLLTILNIHATTHCLGLLNRIKKLLEIEIISFIPSSYAVLNSISGTIFKTSNFSDITCILADCGGRATDISVARQGILEGPKTICLGGEMFTRRIESELELQKKEAEELKIKYSIGQVSPQAKRKIAKFFNTDLSFWLEGIKTALSGFVAPESYPDLILLFGGGAFLPGIKKILAEEAWQQDFNFLGPVKAKTIKEKEIEGVNDNTDLLKEAGDIGLLAVVSFGLTLTRKKSHIDLILYRVVRLMQT